MSSSDATASNATADGSNTNPCTIIRLRFIAPGTSSYLPNFTVGPSIAMSFSYRNFPTQESEDEQGRATEGFSNLHFMPKSWVSLRQSLKAFGADDNAVNATLGKFTGELWRQYSSRHQLKHKLATIEVEHLHIDDVVTEEEARRNPELYDRRSGAEKALDKFLHKLKR